MSTSNPVRVVHVITGLNPGGAELMLLRLLSSLDREMFQCSVISLTDGGNLGSQIERLDVPVRMLGMRRGIPAPWHLLTLARLIRTYLPDVVQTWMYHADLLGGLAAKLAGTGSVVWGIRHTNLDMRANKRATICVAHACARLSGWLPTRIVVCSEASRRVHVEIGYRDEKMIVIPNGFDTSIFSPNHDARVSVRAELGLPDEALLVGLFGRFHPQKDHHNFIQAAAIVRARFPAAHFVLCGDGINWQNTDLTSWIRASGDVGSFRLLGRREDMPRLTAALDIGVVSSRGEGFPNVVGEAMACGVPCVATDVGGVAELMGATGGSIVPAQEPAALAAALSELIEVGPGVRAHRGVAARQRIERQFRLDTIAEHYGNLYRELADDVRSGRHLR